MHLTWWTYCKVLYFKVKLFPKVAASASTCPSLCRRTCLPLFRSPPHFSISILPACAWLTLGNFWVPCHTPWASSVIQAHWLQGPLLDIRSLEEGGILAHITSHLMCLNQALCHGSSIKEWKQEQSLMCKTNLFLTLNCKLTSEIIVCHVSYAVLSCAWPSAQQHLELIQMEHFMCEKMLPYKENGFTVNKFLLWQIRIRSSQI